MSELCLACGLCCRGHLFEHVRITDDAARVLEAKRLPVVRDDEGPMLVQPCAALEATRCTIYDERPTACRTYACALLRRLERGEVRSDEALAIVARLRQAEAAVVDRVAPGADWRAVRAFFGQPAGRTVAFRTEHLEAFADLARFDVLCKTHLA